MFRFALMFFSLLLLMIIAWLVFLVRFSVGLIEVLLLVIFVAGIIILPYLMKITRKNKTLD